ncbi:MAG: protein kinase, partial [Rhizonema sp. NSF051]|nr:protein kinase [Rhizonema sp. NSF051]
QQVALKLLKDTLVTSEELKKRFETEVTVSAALKNDHIVQVSDYGISAEGYPFYVMEYLRGQSLGQLLESEGRLSVDRSVSIITQVCDGLYHAHQGVTLWQEGATKSVHIKVIHRNLKPDNIFLVSTALGELVKILDFGIAKIHEDTIDRTKLTNTFLGTCHYASPEQLEVETNIDGRADIYSLGIILYEMLSGTDPFGLGLNTRKISEISWAIAHNSKPAQPLRSQPGLSKLPPELEAVVMRCLQKAPSQRFASVDELKQALQAAVTPLELSQNSSGSFDKTVYRPLVPAATAIAQSPFLPPDMPEATIMQGSPSSQPAVPEATIMQGSPSSQPAVPEATIMQGSPSSQPAVPEATIMQGSPSSQPVVPGATIMQGSPSSQPVVPEETIMQGSPSRQVSRTLPPYRLLIGIVIAISVTIIGGIFAYTQWQTHQQNNPRHGKLDTINVS